MTDARDDLVERLPTAPDDDSDFTPALGRKIIAAYQAVLSHEATRIQQLTARAEAAEASLAEAERVMELLTGTVITYGQIRAARAWLDSRRVLSTEQSA